MLEFTFMSDGIHLKTLPKTILRLPHPSSAPNGRMASLRQTAVLMFTRSKSCTEAETQRLIREQVLKGWLQSFCRNNFTIRAYIHSTPAVITSIQRNLRRVV